MRRNTHGHPPPSFRLILLTGPSGGPNGEEGLQGGGVNGQHLSTWQHPSSEESGGSYGTGQLQLAKQLDWTFSSSGVQSPAVSRIQSHAMRLTH